MKKRTLKTNAALNGLKQCFAILFPLITFPYVSRVLGEDGFGQYSFSWSIVSYFVLLAGLGITTYATREGARIRNNKEYISKFCSEVFTINLITTICALFLLIVSSIAIVKLRGYFHLILIQSTALLLNLVGRDWINSIYEDYLYITIRYLIIQIIALASLFVFIKSPADVWKYCLISVFASFGGNIPNIVYIRKYVRTRITTHPNFRKHIRPLFVLFAMHVAITIYVNADITMLGFFADDRIVGIYSLASKVYSMLKTIVNAMIVVTLPRMAFILENDPGQYKETLKQVSSYLAIILFPMATGVFMLSKEVILIVGGSSYQIGANALRILSFAMVFAIWGSFCMNGILIANKRERECLKATFASAIVNVLLNFIALPLWGMIGAAITTLIAESINLVLLLKGARQIVNLKNLDKRSLTQCLMASFTIVFVCCCVKHVFRHIILIVGISFALSVFSYFMALIMMKNTYIYEALRVIKEKLAFRR